MSWKTLAEIAERVALARRQNVVERRRSEHLAKVGTVEAVAQWLAPLEWQQVLDGLESQGQASEERQFALAAGGDEEAWARARVGAAMLTVSRRLGEPVMRADRVDYSLENAVANLLHVADEAGLDPLQVLAGGLDRYVYAFDEDEG